MDLIVLADVKSEDLKIHCAQYVKGDPPLQAFLDGRFREWQEYQARRNFPCRQVLSLIDLGHDLWLFAGLFGVHGVQARTDGREGFRYTTTEVPGLEHLVGRVVVEFAKKFRACYIYGHRYAGQLLVSEIRPRRMTVPEFPGYRFVVAPMPLLRSVVRLQEESWRVALSSVGGVYLVLDTRCGKQYVGSAYGVGGIWSRWVSYVEFGHGGNQELKDLLRRNGPSYADCFQFSVLETCDLAATPEEVIERESYWKSALGSREFGYNSN